jgi:hypothetical protein
MPLLNKLKIIINYLRAVNYKKVAIIALMLLTIPGQVISNHFDFSPEDKMFLRMTINVLYYTTVVVLLLVTTLH